MGYTVRSVVQIHPLILPSNIGHNRWLTTMAEITSIIVIENDFLI